MDDRYDYNFPEADHTDGEGNKKHPVLFFLGIIMLIYSVSFLIATCSVDEWYIVLFSLPFIIIGIVLLRKGLGKGRIKAHVKHHMDDCCRKHDYSGMDPIQREYYEQYDSYHHNCYYGDADITNRRKTRCPHCGRKVRDEYEYCPKCGSRLL